MEDEVTEPMVIVRGERVSLAAHDRALVPTYARWVNDLATNRGLIVGDRPITLDDEDGWYEDATGDAGRVLFTIWENDPFRPIGTSELTLEDPVHRTAKFGILVGEADARGRGLGTEATRLTLDFGFTTLNLHAIQLQVYAFNVGAIRAYEKAGFQHAGRVPEAIFAGGRRHDLILMDCLATEWTSPALAEAWWGDDAR